VHSFQTQASSKATNVSRHIFFNLDKSEIEKKRQKFYSFPFSWHGFAEPGENKTGNFS